MENTAVRWKNCSKQAMLKERELGMQRSGVGGLLVHGICLSLMPV